MKFFRNPEVKRTLLVYAALSAVATAAAFLLPDVVWFEQGEVRSGAAVEEKWGFALFMLAFCLVFVIVYLVSTYSIAEFANFLPALTAFCTGTTETLRLAAMRRGNLVSCRVKSIR